MVSASGALVKRVCVSVFGSCAPGAYRAGADIAQACAATALAAIGSFLSSYCARGRTMRRCAHPFAKPCLQPNTIPARHHTLRLYITGINADLGGGEALSAIVGRIDMAVKFRKVEQATSVVSVVGHMSSSDDLEPHLEVGMRVLVCAPLRFGLALCSALHMHRKQ